MLRCNIWVLRFRPDFPAVLKSPAANLATLSAYLIPILVLLAAYLLGSISGGVVLGRFRGVDIREQGTGHAGGTNALRTQGLRFALGVVAIDVGKGALAAWLGHEFGSPDGPFDVAALGYACAFAAMLGHVWPLWHGFRGGKGAATLVGGLLIMWPGVLPGLLVVWLVTLMLSGYIGLAMAIAGASLPLFAWWSDAGMPRWSFAIAVALFLLFTYRDNLLRIRAGGEARMERARVLHRLWRGGRR